MDEGVEKVHPQGVEKVRVQSGPRRRPLFTPEELEEIRRADEEMGRGPGRRDREMTNAARRAYHAANRERYAGVGDRLRLWRTAHEMSQTELGAILGISRVSVCYWETGAAPIDFDRIRERCPQIMEAFT